MLRLVCWRWQEGKLFFLIVSPRLALCGSRAPHPWQDRGEATSRRRPRNGEDGSRHGIAAVLHLYADIYYYLLGF